MDFVRLTFRTINMANMAMPRWDALRPLPDHVLAPLLRALACIPRTAETRLARRKVREGRRPGMDAANDFDVMFRDRKVGRIWRFDYRGQGGRPARRASLALVHPRRRGPRGPRRRRAACCPTLSLSAHLCRTYRNDAAICVATAACLPVMLAGGDAKGRGSKCSVVS